MKPLFISSTETSPKIEFVPESDIFLIEGESRPENVAKFYDPVMNWLSNYKTQLEQDSTTSSKDLNIDFKLEYFNSSSAKFLVDIFKILDSFPKNKVSVIVNWFYDEYDEDLLENGQEYSNVFNMEFKFIPIEE